MRKSQIQSVSEIISALMKQNGYDEKLDEVRVIKSWEEVLGKTVARYTKSLYIKDKTLFVSLSSSVVRNEIMLIRDDLIKRLNENAGRQVIEKILLK
jgi:predicted nucleic acid-binding Zn ribbon protein